MVNTARLKCGPFPLDAWASKSKGIGFLCRTALITYLVFSRGSLYKPGLMCFFRAKIRVFSVSGVKEKLTGTRLYRGRGFLPKCSQMVEFFRFAFFIVFLLFVWQMRPKPVRANSAEMFGLGSRWAGMGDAAVGLADDFSAAFYNPANLALAKKGSLSFGVLGYGARLKLGKVTAGIEHPLEAQLGVHFPVPFKGWMKDKLWVAIAFSSHQDIVARLRGYMASDVFYPYYDNRTQRLLLIPALSFRAMDHPLYGRLSFGLGFNSLAGLAGMVVGREGPSRSVEARVEERLFSIIRLVAGMSYEKSGFRVGMAYRQEMKVPVTTGSFNYIAGTDLDLDIAADTLFDPHTFVLGASWSSTGKKGVVTSVGLELGYALWRLYKGPYVAVDSYLPLVGELKGDLPDIQFKDSLAVRAGVEHWFTLPKTMRLALRGGVGFETSPVPMQHGRTNMLDGHKLALSLGFGLDLGRVFSRRVWMDVHGRCGIVFSREMKKRLFFPEGECPAPPPGTVDPDDYLVDELPCDRTDPTTLGFQTSNPGYPSVKSGGFVFSGGVTLGVEL